MKKFALAALAAGCLTASAFAQGVVAPGHVIGNGTSADREATDTSLVDVMSAAGAVAGAPLPHVANLAALSSLASAFGTVIRDGYTTAGDSPATLYVWGASACTLNSGAGDNGWQVQAAGGGCWTASLPSSGADVRTWGASSASSDSTSAFVAALTAASAGAAGGKIIVPPTYFKVAQSADLDLNNMPGVSLTCNGGAAPGLQNTSNLTAPCTLQLNPSYTIAMGRNQELAGLRIVNKNIELPRAPRDAINAVAAFSGVGITLTQGSSDVNLHDLTINGFATAINNVSIPPGGSHGGVRIRIDNVVGDDTNFLNMDGCNDTCQVSRLEAWPFVTTSPAWRPWKANTSFAAGSYIINLGPPSYVYTNAAACVSGVSVPTGTGTVSDGTCSWTYMNVNYDPTYTVTGLADNAGLIEVAVASAAVPLVPGDTVLINGITGTNAPAGRYTVSGVSGTHFTLTGTSSTGVVWSSGGTVTLPTTLRKGTAFSFTGNGTGGESASSLWEYGHDICLTIGADHGPTDVNYLWCDGFNPGYTDATPKGVNYLGVGGGVFGGAISNKAISVYANSADSWKRPFVVSGMSQITDAGCRSSVGPGAAVTVAAGAVSISSSFIPGVTLSGCSGGYNSLYLGSGAGPLKISNTNLNGSGISFASSTDCHSATVDGRTTCVPTIASGFCTSPSINYAANGTLAFQVKTGTGCAASAGVLTMPSGVSNVGWSCNIHTVADATNQPFQTGSTPTSVTFTNYTRAGALANWSDANYYNIDCQPL